MISPVSLAQCRGVRAWCAVRYGQTMLCTSGNVACDKGGTPEEFCSTRTSPWSDSPLFFFFHDREML